MGTMPGVMLYFDLRPCLDHLTREEQGMLFQAILDYGETGCPPELPGALAIAWAFIQPRLDQDQERYDQVREQRCRAAQIRWDRYRAERAALGLEGAPVPQHAHACRSLHPVPTTTTTSTSTSTSTSTPTSANNPPPAVQPCGKLHAAKAPDAPQGQLCGKLHHGEGPGPDLPCGKLQGDEASPAGAGRPLPDGGEGFTPPGPAPEGDFNARRRQALAALADWARREGGTPP